MKEGSNVLSCVFVCECWTDLARIQLRLRVFAKMGNDHQLPLYSPFSRRRSESDKPPASLKETSGSLWRLDFPVLVSARTLFLGVWDHFRLLDVPLCYYCASETMWPCIFQHTVFISVLQLICTKASRGNRRVRFWSARLCKKKIQPVFKDSAFSRYLFLFFLFRICSNIPQREYFSGQIWQQKHV